MLACARIGAVHSVVFGGFAADELATASRMLGRRRLSRLRAASSRSGSSHTSRCWMQRSIWPRTSLTGASCSSDRMLEAELRPDVTWTGPRRSRRRSRPIASRSPPPIRFTSCTRQARPVSRRASSATTAAIAVALEWSMQNVYGVEPGEVYWAASDRGLGRRALVHRLRAALHGSTTVLYEGKPVGTPDAGAFWRVISEHGVERCSPRRQLFARSSARIRRATYIGRYDLADFALCSLRASAVIQTRWRGRKATRRSGDRPLVADRNRLGDRRQLRRISSCCRSSPARRPGRCRVGRPGARR